MFGIDFVKRSDILEDTDGTDYGEEEIRHNRGNEEFNTVIASGKADPIKDDVLKKLSILSLHDSCYNLDPMTSNKENGEKVCHSSLYPVAMKKAYVIHGEGSLLQTAIEEFILLDIGKFTNMDLQQWMSLTYHEQKMIRETVDKRKRMEAAATDNLVNGLKESAAQAEKNKQH